MESFRVETTIEEEGRLSLEHVPFSVGDRVEVIVRKPSKVHPSWPEGYIERTLGAIKDESFVRHPQCDRCSTAEEVLAGWDEVMAQVEARRGKYPTLPNEAYSTDLLYD